MSQVQVLFKGIFKIVMLGVLDIDDMWLIKEKEVYLGLENISECCKHL